MGMDRGCLGYLQDQEEARLAEKKRKRKKDWVEIENSHPKMRAGKEFASPEEALKKLEPGYGVVVEIFNSNNGNAVTQTYSHAWKLNYLGVERFVHQIGTAMWHYFESRNKLLRKESKKHGIDLGILENELDYYVIIRKSSKKKPIIKHILAFNYTGKSRRFVVHNKPERSFYIDGLGYLYAEDVLKKLLGMSPKTVNDFPVARLWA